MRYTRLDFPIALSLIGLVGLQSQAVAAPISSFILNGDIATPGSYN